MTAKTHGLEESAEELKVTFEDKPVPEVPPNAKFLRPPPPVQQAESNWPLLTVTRGFFESASLVKGAAAATTFDINPIESEVVEESGWGDDDEEAEEFHDTKEAATGEIFFIVFFS